MKKIDVPVVVTIAGSDSSGGAGIQADIKTISALGSYAASVITALTAQNTLGVQGVYPVSPDFVTEQIESVFGDLVVSAVKIGMLYDEKIIAAVYFGLQKFKPKYSVLDPVMFAKSGDALLKPETLDFLKQNLFPRVSLLTPNILEAEKCLDRKIQTQEEQMHAAISAGKLFQTNVLVKGGHLPALQSSDALYLLEEDRLEWFHAEYIETKNTHGTGCTLSAAIAAFLSQNHSLSDAVRLAKKYLTNALASGKHQVIGQGAGPVDHFYLLREIHHDI